jgi:hypothetical protein
VIFANLSQENFQKLITLILAEGQKPSLPTLTLAPQPTAHSPEGTNEAEIFEDAVPIALMSPVQPSSQLQLLLVHPMNSRKVTLSSSSSVRRP